MARVGPFGGREEEPVGHVVVETGQVVKPMIGKTVA